MTLILWYTAAVASGAAAVVSLALLADALERRRERRDRNRELDRQIRACLPPWRIWGQR